MKGILFVALVAAAVAGGVRPSHAQLYGRSWLGLVSGGYTKAETDGSHGEKGTAFMLAFEKLSYNSTSSMGFGFTFMNVQGETDSLGTSNLASIPMTIYAKAIFGPRWIKAYAGGGIGVHLTRFEAGETSNVVDYQSGFVATIPLGFYVSLGESLLINVGYSFNWMSSTFVDGGVAHIVSVGIGYQKVN